MQTTTSIGKVDLGTFAYKNVPSGSIYLYIQMHRQGVTDGASAGDVSAKVTLSGEKGSAAANCASMLPALCCAATSGS